MEVVKICLVDLIVVPISFSLLIFPSPASSLRWESTTIESLIARPASPTIPTNPMNPKFWKPTSIPRNPRPTHKTPTKRIIPAWAKLFKIITKVMTINPKNKKKVLNNWPKDSALSSASPNWAKL